MSASWWLRHAWMQVHILYISSNIRGAVSFYFCFQTLQFTLYWLTPHPSLSCWYNTDFWANWKVQESLCPCSAVALCRSVIMELPFMRCNYSWALMETNRSLNCKIQTLAFSHVAEASSKSREKSAVGVNSAMSTLLLTLISPHVIF